MLCAFHAATIGQQQEIEGTLSFTPGCGEPITFDGFNGFNGFNFPQKMFDFSREIFFEFFFDKNTNSKSVKWVVRRRRAGPMQSTEPECITRETTTKIPRKSAAPHLWKQFEENELYYYRVWRGENFHSVLDFFARIESVTSVCN